MTTIQFYAYLSGFITFFIGCYFYYLSRDKNLNEKQIKIRKRTMNLFLIISLFCLGYSWI